MKFRPTSVPLITVDPFFSVWSGADCLCDRPTTHWSQKPIPIMAGVLIDEMFYAMVGTNQEFMQTRKRVYQTGLTVTPLSSLYKFEDDFVKAELEFTTPLLLDRLDIMTRPVSYVRYKIERKTTIEGKRLRFVFGINSRGCVNNGCREVEFKKTGYSVCCGNTKQEPLSETGDNAVIDWGYLHLCDKDAFPAILKRTKYLDKVFPVPMNQAYNAYLDMPYVAVEKEICGNELSGVITLAYDEIHPIEYFHKPLDEYYTKFFGSFEEMARAAVSEYDEIKALCDKFDGELMAEAEKVGGENYRNILTIAYRQAIAAHKLVEDEDGNLLFFSKENDSNGCIGTMDVTYPSIPLFLKYNPELVLGMLRPIIKYALSDEWTSDFTPHDVGQYPKANGQVYGNAFGLLHMPVEEAGNMLVCLAAVMKYSGGNKELFEEAAPLMKKWADYLVENGYNPENQLCTDDFAGHFPHNCNLSVKAIMGIASYSLLSGDESYMKIAKEYAKKWEEDAKNDSATRLTFDQPDTWSLKYNMVWDNLLGFNLFSEDVKKREVELYKTKFNRYGVPLDSRKDYTKIDWEMWSTRIYDDKEYFDMICESIVNMINETTDRVPLADWYETKTAYLRAMFCRSVVGGLFINLLDK